MEMKWAMIAISILFGSLFSAVAVEKYQLSQCRIAAIQEKMSADDIAKVCK